MGYFLILYVMLLFGSFLETTNGAATPLKNTTRLQQRIRNGQDIDISNAKFYVFFTCSGVICGGTILSLTRVVTAAHCTIGCDPKNIQMYMGKNSWDEQGERYLADNLFRHPKYDPAQGFQYDIAVVYVSGQIRPNDKVDRTSYLLYDVPIGSTVRSFGYGGVTGGGFAKKLQVSYNVVQDYENNLYRVESSRSGTAGGDSGGPCTLDSYLASVIVGSVTVNGNHVYDVSVNIARPEIVSFIRSHGL
ncbi:chymotrypsin-2-like isoform X1 [Onthophagus taurus]|uniref:chymotrypsin-2-like isoform X1 n=1 Tax=Onthophagus taurus TaxID=166361 RepID=UPI0039BE2567